VSTTADTLDYLALPATVDPDSPDGAAQASPVSVGSEVAGYYIESLLHHGGQAHTYLARRGGNAFALKVYYDGYQPLREALDILQRNECPFLAQLVETTVHAGRHVEVYLYYGSGTLADSENKATFIDSVVVPCLDEALAFLHRQGLVHGDVKPQNVFIAEDRSRVVLGDLGVATTMEHRPARRVRFRGTLEYAPYCRQQGDWISVEPAFDYGALGLTLVSAYTGVNLFEGLDADARNARWVEGFQLPPNTPLKARTLLLGLLEPRPEDRWGHERVQTWLAADKKPPARVGVIRPSQLPHRMRRLDFGFYDGAGVIVQSLEELDAAICKHWEGGLQLLDNMRLKAFLMQSEAGKDAYQKSREATRGEKPDLRLFRLLARLRADEPANTTLRYRSVAAADLAGFIQLIATSYTDDAGEFLTSGAFILYLEAIGLDPAAVEACRAAVNAASGQGAAQNLNAIFTRGSFSLAGKEVRDVTELVEILPTLDRSSILELATDENFLGWLYRNQCGEIADRVRRAK
jgi:Protein kinase domain